MCKEASTRGTDITTVIHGRRSSWIARWRRLTGVRDCGTGEPRRVGSATPCLLLGQGRTRTNGARDRRCPHVAMAHCAVDTLTSARCWAPATAVLLLAAACSGGGRVCRCTDCDGEMATGQSTHTDPAPRRLHPGRSGDVLLHERLWRRPRPTARGSGTGHMDFTPQLANIAPVVSTADLAVCHLEVPLPPSSGPLLGLPTFSAAHQRSGYSADTGVRDGVEPHLRRGCRRIEAEQAHSTLRDWPTPARLARPRRRRTTTP